MKWFIMLFLYMSSWPLCAFDSLTRAIQEVNREQVESEFKILCSLKRDKKRELINIIDRIIEVERNKPWYARKGPLLEGACGLTLLYLGIQVFSSMQWLYKGMNLAEYSFFDDPLSANIWAFFAGDSTVEVPQPHRYNTLIIALAGVSFAYGSMLIQSSIQQLCSLNERYINALAIKALMNNAKEAVPAAHPPLITARGISRATL